MEKKQKRTILRVTIFVAVLIALFLIVYLPLYFSGVLENVTSVESFVEMVRSYGTRSYIILWFLEFIQVILGPVPSTIMTAATGIICPNGWYAYLLCITACLSAAVINFYLGRSLGRKIIVWMTSEETLNKWELRLTQSKYTYFLLMIFPFFPHDILCYVAGTTKISFKYFFTTNFITRSIELLIICFLGTGEIIPYSGWGIPVWIALIVTVIVLIILSLKYEEQINDFMERQSEKFFSKFKKNPDKKNK